MILWKTTVKFYNFYVTLLVFWVQGLSIHNVAGISLVETEILLGDYASKPPNGGSFNILAPPPLTKDLGAALKFLNVQLLLMFCRCSTTTWGSLGAILIHWDEQSFATIVLSGSTRIRVRVRIQLPNAAIRLENYYVWLQFIRTNNRLLQMCQVDQSLLRKNFYWSCVLKKILAVARSDVTCND